MLITTILLVAILCVVLSTGYVVRQRHVAIVERLGRFSSITGPGFHVKVPFCDRIHDVNLMTEDEHLTLNAKTADNVTITLEVSVQYHVDATGTSEDSGVYRSFYTLTDPVGQMRDYLADALRSQVPNLTLDQVFSEKDTIARDIDETLGERMRAYGYAVETVLITDIKLPKDVQESMNRIVASKNDLESATNDANAAKAKTVIAAKAKAEAMKAEGEGIADQRVAIARGIRDSLDTIRGSELTSTEANRLFEYTQWVDMMERFAEHGPATMVLPSDFQDTASTFAQVVAARGIAPTADGTATDRYSGGERG